MSSAVSWFQIPCVDFVRGKRFYEFVLDVTLQGSTQRPGCRWRHFPRTR